MTEAEIKTAFHKAINTRGLGVKVGLTKDQVYHYKHKEVLISTMLEFLWKCDKLELIE